MRVTAFLAFVLAFSISGSREVAAQDDQTLADIRQELSVLYVEVQRLKREMSTTGSPDVNVSGGTSLDRINAIEAELQRLTAKTEKLEFRVEQVVKDGTNRIGDLEFRLVELEGGDVSQLGETTTLGGDQTPTTVPVAPSPGVSAPSGELALGEQADFDAALVAMNAGEFQMAAEMFAVFNQNYPGGPLAVEANLNRGKALGASGNPRESARAFLDSFSGDPTGPLAPEALFKLGSALGDLGQVKEACVTLAEVGVRFPASPMVSEAQTRQLALGCS